MNLVNKTDVPVKNPGDKLTSQDINKINQILNQSVDAINYVLKLECNLNAEVGDYERIFTLEEAIELVPLGRRVLGILIQFLSKDGLSCFRYKGGTWEDQGNWESVEFDYIDGGVWE